MSAPEIEKETASTPQWTEDHEREFRKHLKRLDVETAVFVHDTVWRKA